MKVAVFHSIKQKVYHNKITCSQGSNIEEASVRYGTGGKPLCTECKSLTKVKPKITVYY